MNFAKFLKTPFVKNTSGRLLWDLSNFTEEMFEYKFHFGNQSRC